MRAYSHAKPTWKRSMPFQEQCICQGICRQVPDTDIHLSCFPNRCLAQGSTSLCQQPSFPSARMDGPAEWSARGSQVRICSSLPPGRLPFPLRSRSLMPAAWTRLTRLAACARLVEQSPEQISGPAAPV